MKKKLGLFTLCLASLSTIALTSCNKEASSEQQILNAFNSANKTVKVINQTISINSGLFLLAEEKTTIDTVKGMMKVVTKTANDLSSGEPYSESTSTISYSFKRTELNIKTEMFSSTQLIDNTLIGIVENDYVLSVFGLESSKVKGSVTVEFNASTLDSGVFAINSVEIDYVSSNGNNVSILTEYSY